MTLYVSALMVLNVLLIDLSGIFAIRLIRMLRGDVWGIKLLILFLLCPTTYVWAVFTYTNTFSMPFIMGTLYFGIRTMRKRRHRIRNTVITGMFSAVGYQIRPSSIIPVIAVLLGILFTLRIKNFRQKCVLIGIILLIFIVVMLLSSYICNKHLKYPDEDRTFPFTHWVMMGINPECNGFVSQGDVDFTMSFSTKEEKMKQNIRKIKERFVKMGPKGYALLLAKKLRMVWALGADGYQQYYVNGEDISGVHGLVFGDKSAIARIYCQIFRCTTFFFALISIIFQLRKKGVEEFFVISLTALGVILFFLLWETNKRYNICFMELFLILMGDGMTRIQNFLDYPRELVGKSCVKTQGWMKKVISMAIVLAPVGATVYMAYGWQYYTQDIYEQREVTIQSRVDKEGFHKLKNQGYYLEQTFVTGQAFNEIRVMQKFKNGVDADSYRFELLDSKGTILAEQKFPDQKKSEKDWQVFDVPEIVPQESGEQYTMRIVCEREQTEGIQIAIMPYSSYDIYSRGELTLNAKPMNSDMAFCVSRKAEMGHISVRGYIIAGVIFWILSGILLYIWFSQSDKRRGGLYL